MPVTFTDTEIQSLLSETKILPEDYLKRIQLRLAHNQKQRNIDIQGTSGSSFRVLLRQSMFDPMGFSAILAVWVPRSNMVFRLRRYNGNDHAHQNRLEGAPSFLDFHIHMATERYQAADLPKEDGYAEATDRFWDFESATRCLIDDCGFVVPPSTASSQRPLF